MYFLIIVGTLNRERERIIFDMIAVMIYNYIQKI
jgi:hypothetical protein